MSEQHRKTEFTVEDWAGSDLGIFDREAEYLEHIEPLVLQLRAACAKHKIGMSTLISFGQTKTGEKCSVTHTVPSMEETTPALMLRLAVHRPNIENMLAMSYLVEASRSRFIRFYPPSTDSTH